MLDCAAMGSMAFHTNTSLIGSRKWPPKLRVDAPSSPIWAAAPPCAPWFLEKASKAPWDLPPSMGCQWGHARTTRMGGIVLYLLTEKRMNADAIQRLLYNDCGLKGLSGISNDARDLIASPLPAAKFALEYLFCPHCLFAGMLAAAMGGIDGFVFTAGIGENAPPSGNRA